MQFPRTLKSGGRAALLCPASAPKSAAQAEAACRAVRALGLSPLLCESARRAGSPPLPAQTRAEELTRAFCDPDICAVFAVRGGGGSMRLLAHLDLALLARHPKPLLGFSDITALSLALYRAGLSTLHAPTGAQLSEATEAAQARLCRLLFSDGAGEYGPDDGLCPLSAGTVCAPMLGGNLSLLTATVGTDFFPDLTGKILFLEEVGEPLLRLERMLTTLSLNGALHAVGGLVFGAFTRCAERRQLLDLFSDFIPAGVPAVCGFPCGHIRNHHAFLQGQTVTLSATQATLRFHPIRRTI